MLYVGISLLRFFKNLIQQKRIEGKWMVVAKRKKAAVDANIEAFRLQHLTKFQLDASIKAKVLNCSIEGLKDLIQSKEVSISQILLTYIERTVKYATVNCWLAEVCFKEALELALYLYHSGLDSKKKCSTKTQRSSFGKGTSYLEYQSPSKICFK